MKIVVTGGAGFVGSHVSEFYAKQGHDVTVMDNMSRAQILGNKAANTSHNVEYLKQKYPKISFVNADIRDASSIGHAIKDADTIIHTAAQTAVTASLTNPRVDFEVNAVGTFNILEAARNSRSNPVVVVCSTNKVYGNNVNKIPVREGEKKYEFSDPKYKKGIPENFSTDLCEHTPYGCSKFLADVYTQDYAYTYGLKTGVFRMSCIYGTRQFGVEDQGWVAWFVIAYLMGKPLTIYGDGKQVRDVLYVEDLVRAYDLFIKQKKFRHGVFNTGGGADKTLSLLELVEILDRETGTKKELKFSDWRPSDQKVYISDITKANKELGWTPVITPTEGVKRLIDWILANKQLFR